MLFRTKGFSLDHLCRYSASNDAAKNDSVVCPLLQSAALAPDPVAALKAGGELGRDVVWPYILGQHQCRLRGWEMRRGWQNGVVIAACSGLVACADAPNKPAPVFLNGGPGMSATRSAAAKVATPDTRFVIVGPGQSLGGIAEANDVPKQAIIAANHLSPPYKLKIGQMLRLPVSVAASVSSRDKVAVLPKRSGQVTVLADTRSSKHAASEEMIPLDDPTPPRIAGSAATAPHPAASDQTNWVSPAPASQ